VSFKSLALTDKVPVPRDQANGSFAVQLPMKCDPEGTIYVRFAGMGLQSSVLLIREDGKIASSIGLSGIPELSKNDFYDFAPGNGDVFLLSGQGKPHTQPTYYISRFKTDGTYVSSVCSIRLQAGFRTQAIPAFPSGDL
jgi:hypothetical protein